MPTSSTSVQCAILPVGSAHRAQVAALLASAGIAEGDPARAERCQLAVVDLTEPDGRELLRELVACGITAVALVDPADPQGIAAAQQLGADFVDCSALSRELVARVRRALSADPRQTKGFLEGIINASGDAIIAADLKGKVIVFNKGAEELCGYIAQEAIGTLKVEDLYAPGVARQVMAQLRDSQASGRLGPCRQELVRKGGERVPVSMTASILYEGEQELATVGIFTDLRDRMQLERKLSDFENRLEQSEKTSVIVELAGTAAHELNQPLTSVMGYADLLKRKLKEDDFAYRPIDIIYREAERMAEIVRKIGKITRYETKSYIGSAKILDLDKASSHED